MFITSAHAQATGAAPGGGGIAGLIQFFAPFALVLVAFYVIMWLPQQKRQKAFRAMIEGVKKGDQVVTAGGVAGRVTKVEDRFVEVEIAVNTRVRVVKSTLAEVTGVGKAAND
ncbi:preprotein translocase subunit YajC [Sphingomonas bacterium]|uniref:preprotein translocase subunit YajC n=1 Tax=Sphingomonas bacterium TaxID=1895847 RepID=UPI001576426B|nr:preprotein translocase subunit YajC [Sphingomonas bacterium]